MSRTIFPEPCVECEGYGYDVLDCDGIGHPPVELQRIDACDCLEKKLGRAPGTDDDAAVLFVRDLERGDERAQRIAGRLVVYGAPVHQAGDE